MTTLPVFFGILEIRRRAEYAYALTRLCRGRADAKDIRGLSYLLSADADECDPGGVIRFGLKGDAPREWLVLRTAQDAEWLKDYWGAEAGLEAWLAGLGSFGAQARKERKQKA